MDSELTDITLVVDRSGSMQAIHSDAEGGINAFIQEQAAQEGRANLTLVQFDTEYEFVHKGVPIHEVPAYTLQPRGATALLDAVGRGINETGARLAKLPEAKRPGLVVFVIVTDGHENSSREFNNAQIKEMIEHQQTKYSWQFTFLGADQQSFDEAMSWGMNADSSAVFRKDKMSAAYAATSSKLSRMRQQSYMGKIVSNEYTAEERESME